MRSRRNLLNTLLSKATGSREVALVVSGASGAGKSWMLRQLQHELGAHPHVLLRISPMETNWPLSSLIKLLSELDLAEPLALDHFLPESPGQGVDSYAVARHLHAKLPALVTPGTVILLDDVDLMDEASLEVLGFMSTWLQRNRAKFIVTVASGPIPEPLAGWEILKLRGLTEAESLALARETAGVDADPAVLHFTTTTSRGMPGSIIEQLDRLQRQAQAGELPLTLPLPVGTERTGKLSTVVARLEEEHQQVLTLLAAAPVTERATVLALKPGAVSCIDELEQRGFLMGADGHVQISDPALRSTLYWGLNLTERQSLHRHLQEHGEDPTLKLYHRTYVDQLGVTASELVAAAEQLVEQGQVAAAIEVAERGLLLPVTGTHLPQALHHLAEILCQHLQLEAARRYVRFGRRLPLDPAASLALATLDVQLSTLKGRVTAKNQHAAPISELENIEPHGCVRLLGALATEYALREDHQHTESLTAQATELVSRFPEAKGPEYEAAQLLCAALNHDRQQLMDRFHQLPVVPKEPGDGILMLALGVGLSTTDCFLEAREVFSRLAAAPEGASPLMERLLLLLNAANAILNQNYPRAMQLVERWIAADGPALLSPIPQLIQAWYWMNKNRPDMAEWYFQSLEPRILGESSPMLLSRIAMMAGDRGLMTGDYPAAVEAYRRTLRLHQGPGNLRYVRATCALIEALVMLGRTEEAVDEYRSRQEIMAAVPGRRPKLAMRCAQALAMQGTASLTRFQQLLDDWTGSDNTFELARLRHCFGQRLRSMGRTEAAREHLQAARALYRSLGALGWMATLEDLEAPVAAASRNTPLSLSREEIAVVRMVHDGLTNKAIAKELFISVSAVEARLTKLYRRTGTRNRQQLAARYASMAPPRS